MYDTEKKIHLEWYLRVQPARGVFRWMFPVTPVYGPEETDDECSAPEFRRESTRYGSFTHLPEDFTEDYILRAAADGFYVERGTARIRCYYCGSTYPGHSSNCQRHRFNISFSSRYEYTSEDLEIREELVTGGVINLRNPHQQETQLEVPQNNDHELLMEIVRYGRVSIRADVAANADHMIQPARIASSDYSDISLHSSQPCSRISSSVVSGSRGRSVPETSDQRVIHGPRNEENNAFLRSIEGHNDGARAGSSSGTTPRELSSTLQNPNRDTSHHNPSSGLQQSPCNICEIRPAVTIFCRRCCCFISCIACAQARPQLRCPLCQHDFVQL